MVERNRNKRVSLNAAHLKQEKGGEKIWLISKARLVLPWEPAPYASLVPSSSCKPFAYQRETERMTNLIDISVSFVEITQEEKGYWSWITNCIVVALKINVLDVVTDW